MNNTHRHPSEPLLDLDTALQRIAEDVKPIGEIDTIPLTESLGRITAQALTAPVTLPAFDSSAVDGYAVRHSDIVEQTALRVIGQSLAGHPYPDTLAPNSAVRIATGAQIPSGADTVIMQEQCREQDGLLTFQTTPSVGNAIRKAGSDFIKGATALAAGRRLQPYDCALLGALGYTDIPVRRKIKIAILSTGAELRPAGSALAQGQITDTNGLMLRHLLERFAVDVDLLPALPDDYNATAATLQNVALTHDLIITSGGVSVGSHDFVRDAVHNTGKVHFWRLAIRPGKPVLLGQIGTCLLAGLPGNPVSAMVTFFLIVAPVLQALNGQAVHLPPAFQVPLGIAYRKDATLRDFPRARLEWQYNEWKAFPIRDQSSHLIGAVTGTDGLLDLPSGTSDFAEDMLVSFRPFMALLG